MVGWIWPMGCGLLTPAQTIHSHSSVSEPLLHGGSPKTMTERVVGSALQNRKPTEIYKLSKRTDPENTLLP